MWCLLIVAADVALEAPLEGEQWPQLYLNRVTTEEAIAIAAMLTTRSLAENRIEGYVPFYMKVNGEIGQEHVSGLIGDGS